MGSIYVSFVVNTVSVCSDNTDILDKSFHSLYKPLFKFLYSHPSFPVSLSLSGPIIQYFKRRKNELIAIMRELVDRNQIELLGGGYYEPLLPLLYSVDRNGQIDLLTAEIRHTFGKRPRGMTLFQDCWDSSLVNNIHTCGLEYILLDNLIVQESNRCFLPLYMSDLGKDIDIFLTYNNLLPDSETLAEEFLWNVEKTVLKVEKKDHHLQLENDRIVVFTLNQEQVVSLLESKWFEALSEYISNNPESRIKLTTPNLYRQHAIKTKIPAYIPVGISATINSIIMEEKGESKQRFPSTIYDFMYNYKASFKLYNRMMYLCMLVNQYKNDKIRKKTAREKIWQAQNGISYIGSSNIPLENSIYRQQAYKYLNEADKILRGDGKFEESVTCFDYDNNGINEYVCRMDQYFAYISLEGGSVPELDVIKNSSNYADNLNKKLSFDDSDDGYDRGFFIDYLFTEEQLKKYVNGEAAGDGVFSRIQYNQLKYSQQHHEIQLYTRAVWKPTGQTVYLRKKYVINSTGMYIQYIIKNESSKPLHAKFAVESNMTDVSFNQKNYSGFSIETVDKGQICLINTNSATKVLNDKGKLLDIHVVRISDQTNGISFVFEPNEKCGYIFNPLNLKRKGYNGELLEVVNKMYVSTLFWDVNIEAGMETEKSINFTIIPVKKIKKQ